MKYLVEQNADPAAKAIKFWGGDSRAGQGGDSWVR